MIGKILVGLSGTPYADVSTTTAIELARRHNAQLTGVTVVDLDKLRQVGPVPVGAGAAAAELRTHRLTTTRERVEECIERFNKACTAAGVEHSVLYEERQESFDYLISQSRYHDLIVLGLRGIFEFGVTGEAEYDPSLLIVRLLGEGVRPVIAVGPTYREIKRVFIAYSGSLASANTMKRFFQLQPWGNVEVCIATFDHEQERRKRLLRHAENYCRSQGIAPETQHFAEAPKDQLLAAAQAWQADLVVMGNSQRTLLLRRMLGETMLHMVQTSELPLFLSQ